MENMLSNKNIGLFTLACVIIALASSLLTKAVSPSIELRCAADTVRETLWDSSAFPLNGTVMESYALESCSGPLFYKKGAKVIARCPGHELTMEMPYALISQDGRRLWSFYAAAEQPETQGGNSFRMLVQTPQSSMIIYSRGGCSGSNCVFNDLEDRVAIATYNKWTTVNGRKPASEQAHVYWCFDPQTGRRPRGKIQTRIESNWRVIEGQGSYQSFSVKIPKENIGSSINTEGNCRTDNTATHFLVVGLEGYSKCTLDVQFIKDSTSSTACDLT